MSSPVSSSPHIPTIFKNRTDKKFHVEHFTCSLCSILFGPQDSYYEHEGDVYCHFHYSTRFATKCAGCSSAILKQFVEINRNMKDECWHPECYMINKVRLYLFSRFVSPAHDWMLIYSKYSSGMSRSYRGDQTVLQYLAWTRTSQHMLRKNNGSHILR